MQQSSRHALDTKRLLSSRRREARACIPGRIRPDRVRMPHEIDRKGWPRVVPATVGPVLKTQAVDPTVKRRWKRQ